MKKAFILIIAVLSFTSCKEKTKEYYIEEAFKNYVYTDFGDPDEFLEVTSIVPIDTVNRKTVLEMIDKFKEISFILPDYDKERMADFENSFKKDNTELITYKLKVRIKNEGRKSVKVYYVIDNGSEYKVQDHTLLIDELPELYRDFCQYSGGLLE